MTWLFMAILSALFAGLTSILAKCGIRKTDSDVATALRTIVVLLFSWLMVLIVGSLPTISSISPKSFLFLGLSGLATGASWICYFKALSLGNVNKVVPVDKSSTILTVLLAIICFGETDNLPVKLSGTLLLAIGIFLMIEKKQSAAKEQKGPWMIYAILAAVFAALTSILAKMGISGVESNLGTALRTCVVLVMAWIVVFSRGKQKQLAKLDKKSSYSSRSRVLPPVPPGLAITTPSKRASSASSYPSTSSALSFPLLFPTSYLKNAYPRRPCLVCCSW